MENERRNVPLTSALSSEAQMRSDSADAELGRANWDDAVANCWMSLRRESRPRAPRLSPLVVQPAARPPNSLAFLLSQPLSFSLISSFRALSTRALLRRVLSCEIPDRSFAVHVVSCRLHNIRSPMGGGGVRCR